MKGGDATFTVSIAEISHRSYLSRAAKLFTKNKEDLAKLMKNFAGKLFPEKKEK